MKLTMSRRRMIGGAGAMAAAMTLPIGRVFAQAVDQLSPIPIPPPISQAERLQRVAAARELMRKNGIGAVLVEIRPQPRLFHRHPMVAERAADRRRHSGRGRRDRRHAVLRKPDDQGNAADPGGDPHVAGRPGSAQAGRRLPARARPRVTAGRLRRNRPLLHRGPAQAIFARRADRQRQPGRARAADDQIAGRARADAGGQ